MKLILLGPPGAGKGTHAKHLRDKYGLTPIATGDILRRHIKEKTELGMKAKDIIESGGLVPDDIVNNMMAEEIRRVGLDKGFILDGYPRTLGQAEALDRFLKSEQAKIDLVINFATSEEVVIDRLSGRRMCANCGGNFHIRNIPPKKEGVCDQCGEVLTQRKDDNPETIKNRLKMYHEETFPLIEFYQKGESFKDIPGDRNVQELQDILDGILGDLKAAS